MRMLLLMLLRAIITNGQKNPTSTSCLYRTRELRGSDYSNIVFLETWSTISHDRQLSNPPRRYNELSFRRECFFIVGKVKARVAFL